MYKISFNSEAEEELNYAADYYESRKEGLGISFLHEIQKSLQIIQTNPNIGQIYINTIRRIIIKRFPYSIVYSINEHEIYIIAIAHLKRKPKYWEERK